MKHNWKKIIAVISGGVAGLLILALSGFLFLFRHELKTLSSFQKIDDNVLYVMEYDGDYGFDEFLESGASSDGELVEFVTKRLLKGIPLEFSIPDLGCSTFHAQTAEGDQIFGRNFDLTYSPALFVKTEPDHGYRSYSTVNLAFLGFGEEKLPETFMQKVITLAAPYAPLDGINEKGVSIGVLRIADEPTHQDEGRIDITTTTAVRLVLDKAATVEEAIALLEQYDMHSSAGSCYHFQITDAQGDSAVVEYVDNEFVVLKAEKNYQMATNFLLAEQKYNFGTGQDRYETLKTTLEECGGVLADEQAGMDLLEAVSRDWHISESSGRRNATQWSIIYNNTDLTAKVITARQYEKPAHEFSLNE